jgi:serine/threonine protein kinase
MGRTLLDNVTSKELYGMDFYHANLITYYAKGDNSTSDISDDFHEKILCGHGANFSKHLVRNCKKFQGDPVDKFIWIAMPYANGKSLADISAKRFDSDNHYDVSEAIQIIKQILAGIGYLHKKEYVHRDIKPGNVLYFDQDKQWRVSDYGLLGKLEDGLAQSLGGGTPGWMAPEQSGRPVDVRADIYSIGQVFYYLLTGDYHFKYAHDKTPLPSQLNQQVSEALSALVLKCVEVDPSNRFPDISTLAEQLVAIETGELLKKVTHYQGLGNDVDSWNHLISNLLVIQKELGDDLSETRLIEIEFANATDEDDLDKDVEDEDSDYYKGDEEGGDEDGEDGVAYDLESEESDLWGPCTFYTTFFREHSSTVRYKHSISRKEFSIYVPKELLRMYGVGDTNSEFPFEIKVSYKEVSSETPGPRDLYLDYQYHDWHGDSLQYRRYVGSHYDRIYVPKVALDGREPEIIRLELEI